MSMWSLCRESSILLQLSGTQGIQYECWVSLDAQRWIFLLGNLTASDLSGFHLAAYVSAGRWCLVMLGKDCRQEKCSVVGRKWLLRDSTVEYCKSLGEGCSSKPHFPIQVSSRALPAFPSFLQGKRNIPSMPPRTRSETPREVTPNRLDHDGFCNQNELV